MKTTLCRAALFWLMLTPPGFAEASLMRNIVQSCAFGAGVLATTTYTGLTPALSTGVLAVPAGEAIAANAIIGCGVGAAGATAATLATWIYDLIF